MEINSGGGGGSTLELEVDGVPNGDQTLLNLVAGTGVDLVDSGTGSVTISVLTGGVSGSGTTNEITYWTGASTLGSLTVATYPSLTELTYVKGVTSAIQTQLNAKMTNPMTTGGDLIYGGASGTPTRLANGSAGQVLQSNGTTLAPTWETVSASPGGADTQIQYNDGGVSNGASDFVYTKANGRVGIGATSPSTLLQIGSTAQTTAAYGIQFQTDTVANLYRSAAGTIKTDGDLVVGGGDISLGGAGGTATISYNQNIALSAPNLLFNATNSIIFPSGIPITFNGNLIVGNYGASQYYAVTLAAATSIRTAGQVPLSLYYHTDANPKFRITGVGSSSAWVFNWGAGGASATDTNLFRDSANVLRTNDSLIVDGSIGIATTAPDKALEVNSATGANLRLTYNDANGSATNYSDFTTGSTGGLTITAAGTNPKTLVVNNESSTGNIFEAQDGGGAVFTVADGGDIQIARTITTAGTTGNQTINKASGTVNIAAAGTTVTVTNSLCTTSSIVHAVLRTNDTTASIINVVPGAGSFVINIVACTAEVSIGFLVTN